jgi:hypothetical protein
MRHPLVIARLVALLAVPVACARWVPLNDRPTQAEVDPASAYAAVLKVAGERGYAILEQKDAERSVKLRAHVDEKRSDRASYITAQVDASGHVRLNPSGFLVRGNTVHSKLASEITYFNDALQGELKRAPPLAVASASALPPPPEPPPAAETASASAAAAVPPAPPKPVAKPASTATGKAPAAPKGKPKSGDDWETVK